MTEFLAVFLVITLVLSAIADAMLTSHALRLGAKKLNPLVNWALKNEWTKKYVWPVKFGVTIAIAVVVFNYGEGWPRIYVLLPIVLMMGYVCWNGVKVLDKQRSYYNLPPIF